MPVFGKASLARRATLHPDLQRLLDEVIKHIDIAIVCGHRSKEDQDAAVAAGKSETPWPTSKHNTDPSLAADVAPYLHGIAWEDKEAFDYTLGIIKGIALMMGIPLRTGVDWDGDLNVEEHKFKDRDHIELVL